MHYVLCGKICKMVLNTELFYAIIPACFRGATALLVAVATPAATRRSASYRSKFQLTHTPRGNHTLSIASNGGQKEDTTLLQHLATTLPAR